MTGTTQPMVMQAYPMLHAAGEQLLREHVRLITASEPSEECIRHEGRDAVAIIARRPIRIGGDVMDALPLLRLSDPFRG